MVVRSISHPCSQPPIGLIGWVCAWAVPPLWADVTLPSCLQRGEGLQHSGRIKPGTLVAGSALAINDCRCASPVDPQGDPNSRGRTPRIFRHFAFLSMLFGSQS